MKNYTEDALSKLVNQFYNSERLKTVLKILVSELDDIYTKAQSIKFDRFIKTAEGKQLDGIGDIVNEPRQGDNDDDYRYRLLLRIFINTAAGTPPSLLKALSFATEPTDMQYIEVYPATVILFTDGLKVTKSIQPFIQNLAPVAISEIPVIVSYGNKPFRLGRTATNFELIANNPNAKIFQANEADLKINQSAAAASECTLGGLDYPILSINGKDFLLSSKEVTINNTEKSNPFGEYTLPGVFN